MVFLCLWVYLINLIVYLINFYLIFVFLSFFLPTFQFLPNFGDVPMLRSFCIFKCIFYFYHYLDIFFIDFLNFWFLVGFRFFFSIQNTWKNHLTLQFHQLLTIFSFSDIFEISYEYSLNQYPITFSWFFEFQIFSRILSFFNSK